VTDSLQLLWVCMWCLDACYATCSQPGFLTTVCGRHPYLTAVFAPRFSPVNTSPFPSFSRRQLLHSFPDSHPSVLLLHFFPDSHPSSQHSLSRLLHQIRHLTLSLPPSLPLLFFSPSLSFPLSLSLPSSLASLLQIWIRHSSLSTSPSLSPSPIHFTWNELAFFKSIVFCVDPDL
jgi:hypothetical protein